MVMSPTMSSISPTISGGRQPVKARTRASREHTVPGVTSLRQVMEAVPPSITGARVKFISVMGSTISTA